MSEETRVWCGCSDNNCGLSLVMSTKDANEILGSGLIIIINGCMMGVDPGYSRVGGTKDYCLYKEAEEFID